MLVSFRGRRWRSQPLVHYQNTLLLSRMLVNMHLSMSDCKSKDSIKLTKHFSLIHTGSLTSPIQMILLWTSGSGGIWWDEHLVNIVSNKNRLCWPAAATPDQPILIMITKWRFWGSVFRKISGPGDFSPQNLRVRRFWDWKSPDPEILYETPLI